MDTNHLAALVARAPLAEGYRFELLRRADVDLLMASLRAWYPDIGVGAASCFLRSRFYADEVQFADGPQRDVHVLALRHGGELVGMFSWDVDRDTLSMYGRLGVVDPAHRGCRLAEAGLWLLETVAAVIGAGLLYGMATLKYPHVQRVFERAGWTLVGITPGYDREMVAPGVVKRVYEAVYMKVMASEGELLPVQEANMTPGTRALFQRLFRREREVETH